MHKHGHMHSHTPMNMCTNKYIFSSRGKSIPCTAILSVLSLFCHRVPSLNTFCLENFILALLIVHIIDTNYLSCLSRLSVIHVAQVLEFLCTYRFSLQLVMETLCNDDRWYQNLNSVALQKNPMK